MAYANLIQYFGPLSSIHSQNWRHQQWVPFIGHNLNLKTITMQVIKDEFCTRGTFVHDSTCKIEKQLDKQKQQRNSTTKNQQRNWWLPAKDTETSSRCCPSLKPPYSLMYSSIDKETKNLCGYGFLPSFFAASRYFSLFSRYCCNEEPK